MKSLDSRSDLAPHPPLWVKLRGHKIVDFVFWPFISFILAFTALESIKRYWETICEEFR